MSDIPTELVEELHAISQHWQNGTISTLQAAIEQIEAISNACPERISPSSVDAIKAFITASHRKYDARTSR